MSMALIGFISIIVISLLFILFYLLTINDNKPKKIGNEFQRKMSVSSIADLNTMEFPKNIEHMRFDSLSKATKVIFDSYKALNYVNKLPSSLDKIEWHTWQVSIILKYLKSKNKIFITNDNIFHTVILELSESQIEHELQKIYNKYIENVNIKKSRDDLSKDVIWSAREVSIILYKIINCK
ncbi:MAG: hypothetical protein PHG81_13165 [Aliarcobacter sp.]|nr:hypothetical protein [Aliarcobacter sp.]